MYTRVLIFLAFLQLAVSETYDKVNLTYAYETRCPFCVQFVDQQFYSGYKTLSDYINIDLVVYVGEISDTGDLTCGHGENECFISKAQACVFQRSGITEVQRVEFLHCTEAPPAKGNDVTDADIEACVNSYVKDIVSYETVQTCMNGNEFVPTLQEYKAKAQAFNVEFVPWLAFFDEYNQTEYNHLRSDFVAAVCEKLTNPPNVCQTINFVTKLIN